MTLREQLKEDLQQAIRDRDATRKAALRVLLGPIQMEEAEKGTLSDAKVLRYIEKEVKRRVEALEMAKEAGREKIVAEDSAELEILKAYLPPQLEEDELRELVQEVITEIGASSFADFGKIMQTIMPRVRGKADGNQVNKLVREILSS